MDHQSYLTRRREGTSAIQCGGEWVCDQRHDRSHLGSMFKGLVTRRSGFPLLCEIDEAPQQINRRCC
ncbi:uncharacterized protein CCOS01_07812 [Colletotrichum costaricense]|uniref:Uncharacterized protein n=2 Tax=Colletotrichum acutatum species complex TaxID=2707335 RepID=A0AAJ0E1D2_9PEZI|nr:uncharacterized protein CCOS01_07812 [Colletotrichum costaricense]XP_060384631.1 uncharacterized protein CTAM01_04647 [Colletotrichum tamarilloi]KAI3551568.1 hypothetical protein CSPX01_00910 [Colletotrichum filicis]KAK1503335.1 hypothetical protein CTAM01_04647 [Colletotrichum tamarilloi]KAK1527550.1 hypothetical protein CCOS01_07812 [Colletotrichum costaricense]